MYNSGWTTATSVTLPPGVLGWNSTYYWHVYTYDGVNVTAPNWTWSFRPLNNPPTVAAPQQPPNGDTSHTLTPTLSATASDPDGDPVQYWFRVATGADAETGTVFDSGWTSSSSVPVPAGILGWNTPYYWHVYTYDGAAVTVPGWVRSFTPTNHAPTVVADSPADGAVSATLSPTLASTGSDADAGDSLSYQYLIATGADARSGGIADSGWRSSGQWQVPVGALQDGRSYYWIVRVRDQIGAESAFTSPRSITINQALGVRPSLAMDTVGPVSVNLANGNAVVAYSTPTFGSLGGPLGLSFTYNSLSVGTGLTGSYANDDGNRVFDESPVTTRVDPTIHFNWSGMSPAPGVNADNFVARWTGSVVVPATASNWQFGTISDDGVRVWVDNTLVVDRWSDQSPTSAPQYGATMALTANTKYAVRVEYYQHRGGARLELWARGPVADQIVGPSWLHPDNRALPDGWRMSQDPTGSAPYVRAQVGDTQVVLYDPTGSTHTYTRVGAAFRAPDGEHATLAVAADGTLTAQAEDGTTATFTAAGDLATLTSPADHAKPAAPTYAWTGSPSRLASITDPVSRRAITLTYAPSGCPSVAGYSAPPPGSLCRIDYGAFAGGETDLLYSGGHLARIVDPGGATTDLGYDAAGRLAAYRDVLTNDVIAGGAMSDPASTTHLTQIAYDAVGRVASITGPVPSPGALRPAHRYTYAAADVTLVGVDGADAPVGYARRVSTDGLGRIATDADGAGNATTFTWDPKGELLTKQVDADGLVSTHLYDAAGRETDSYGPGSAAEFDAAGRSPSAPHSLRRYDEGITGLAAQWWPNASQAGAPKAFTTATAQQSWPAGTPDASIAPGAFSGRLTGEITAPIAGDYTFGLDGDAGRVFVDDKLVADRWGGPWKAGVIADGPAGFWRLGDPPAASNGADALGGDPIAYTGTHSAPAGGIANDDDRALGLDGTGAYALTPDEDFAFADESVTLEVWFKAAAAGVIVTELGQTAPNTAWHDSQLEVLSTGEVRARVWNLPSVSLGTAAFGAWHHAVVRYDKAQLRLDGFLDGARSAAVTGDREAPWESGYAQRWALGAPDSTNMGSGASFNGAIDDFVVYPAALPDARVGAHRAAGRGTGGATTGAAVTLTAGAHRVRVDHQHLGGAAGMSLRWTRPGQAPSAVAQSALAPRYGLVTSQRDPDGHETATVYGDAVSGVDPAWGRALRTTRDPAGLALTTSTAYEAPGQGYARRVSRSLPKGPATTVTTTYWGDTETAAVPCPGGAAGVNQAGMARRTTNADPDGAGPQLPRVDEVVYDPQGRVAATRVAGDSAWECATYDQRGRPLSRRDRLGATTTYDYSVAATLTTRAPDSAGVTRTTTATTDWAGRPVAYLDEHATLTETVFDQAGRVASTWRSDQGGPRVQVTGRAYEAATGRLGAITDHVSPTPATTTFSYTPGGRLATTTRPNNVATTVGYDPQRGSLTSITNRLAGVELAPWSSTYARNPSGTIATQTTAVGARGYSYDQAGRLTKTTDSVSGERLYAYDANTNRCAHAAGCATPTYTYDSADRITASPQASGYTYDSHGNMTQATPTGTADPLGLRVTTIAYDANDHATTIDDGLTATTSTLTPDGRVLRRRVTDHATGLVSLDTTYGYADDSDSPAYLADTTTGVRTTYIQGPGLLVTHTGPLTTYPLTNAHGDIVATTDANGVPTPTPTTDEYGVGTTPPDRLGWLGTQQRYTEHATLGIIRMGARLYDPNLGRFLQVDPVEGGSANDYDYAMADPCNNLDLDGREWWRMVPGVRCVKAGTRFRSYITRQRRAFERINARRDIPLSGAQQWEIVMTSGYAHDMLDYCGGDALKVYERMVRRGGR